MNRRGFLKASAGGILLGSSGLVLPQEYVPAPTAAPVVSFVHPTLASRSFEKVAVRLVSWMDVSGSIDDVEYELQRTAMAKAIDSDDFRYAIFSSSGVKSIALCVGQFGSSPYMPIPWLDIRKKDEAWKLKALAEEIMNLPRPEAMGTNQYGALDHSILWFQKCPWQATRNILDLITDGVNDTGPKDTMDIVERLARELRVTVNALVIEDNPESRIIETFARDYLITKPRTDGSYLDPGFVKVVAYENAKADQRATVEYRNAVTLAFRSKLILEVARMEPDELRRQIRFEAANQSFFRKLHYGL